LYFRRIEIEANKLFAQLQQQQYFQHQPFEQLIESIADLYCELNVIHPFREGNGRTQRIFFEHLLAFVVMAWTGHQIQSQHQWYKPTKVTMGI
jgi:cell filamentation protein